MGNDKIKLIVTDVDGTLTDGSVFHLPQGQFRRFSTFDGYGFEIARDSGVEVVLMSKSRSQDIVYRAEHLGVDCGVGIKDKEKAVRLLALDRDIELESVCFMGNDTTDLGAMSISGFSACPADAHGYILSMCDTTGFTSVYNGGHGAFRQLIDWLVLWGFKKVPYPNILFTAESKSH